MVTCGVKSGLHNVAKGSFIDSTAALACLVSTFDMAKLSTYILLPKSLTDLMPMRMDAALMPQVDKLTFSLRHCVAPGTNELVTKTPPLVASRAPPLW